MDRFFSTPAMRPKIFEFLTVIKSRSDCIYLARDIEKKVEVFQLDEEHTVTFHVKDKCDGDYIKHAIDTALARFDIRKNSALDRNIRLGLARYRSWVHQVNMFREKAADLRRQELKIVDEIFQIFLDEDDD